MKFNLVSKFSPTGDQPSAIQSLISSIKEGSLSQTLLGVTGSGKTFTVANIINELDRPALIISHNKTLAGQLYEEFKNFFPKNSVHYFVSYYDYYQPEAYMPASDTYIEKDAKINEVIDALRHASTSSILSRRDVIIVASVSCIYGIGDPISYQNSALNISLDDKLKISDLSRALVSLQYARNALDPREGHFRTRENTVEIYPPSGNEIVSIEIEKGKVAGIFLKLKQSGAKEEVKEVKIFPAKHFVTPHDKLGLAIKNIKLELKSRITELKKKRMVLEAARLKQRTEFDLDMLEKTGYVNGIENYSRQLSFRKEGEPPSTLIDYFRYAHPDFLTIIDESHVSVPQIRGMYNGDRSRKQVLVNYGFRLPSAIDNRPLQFAEFNKKIGQTIYVSATPSKYELDHSRGHISQQLIRPTGILDPKITVLKTEKQVKETIKNVKERAQRGERSLVMALTKRLAEDISDYMEKDGIKTAYLHSEIKTFDRMERIKKLRLGHYDCLVGVNLLREGLDLPEVSFISVLDADKEGFLRNYTTLLQIVGRAARHPNSEVILFGDRITDSMRLAISETKRRRMAQQKYNAENNITPQKITRDIRVEKNDKDENDNKNLSKFSREMIASLEKEMKKAARELNFERARELRDKIRVYRHGKKTD